MAILIDYMLSQDAMDALQCQVHAVIGYDTVCYPHVK